MKTLIISLLFILTANAQNIWYVNANNTSGPWNGRSWATAWRYLDSSSWAGPNGINWKVIQQGDTIYFSGGTDSLLYTPNIQAHSAIYGFWVGRGDDNNPTTFANGNPVVLAPAWHPGHNGKVIFTTSNDNQMSLFRVMNISNVKITGFTFSDRRINPSASGPFISFGNSDNGNKDSLQIFENNHVIGNGNTGFIYLNGTKTTIRNNYLESIQNDKPADCDPMGISGGRGGHVIDRNIIIMRNGNVGTDAHRDGIQFSNFGQPNWGYNERLPITVSNNLIIDTRPEGTSWNAMIYSSGPYTNAIFYVYNNIIVNRKFQTNINSIWIGKGGIAPWTNYKTSLHILNNTIITKGYAGAMVTAYNHDTLIVKNNIFIVDTSNWDKIHNLDGSDGFPNCYKRFDYNHYGILGGNPPSTRFAVDNGLNITWNNWRNSYNQDVNSTLTNSTSVTFVNKYGITPQDYYTTTGRGTGENLLQKYPFLSYDILGNPRPQTGAWDIGALQFQGSPSINVQGKIFLQGPFSSNSMSTNLVQNGFLPTSQPYNSAPWNYSGNEVLGSGASSAFVDWVLVELRSSSNPAQVVGRRAAILRNDGRLVDTDGTLGVRFNNMNDGTYYVAVFHRNHLAIMSANPVQLSNNSQLYDFTNAMNKAYGTNPMASLPGGVFGMLSGDGNSDDGVTITDRNDVWQLQNGTMGYLKGDFNLDGGVNIIDANGFWSPNNGRQSQVP